MSGAGMLTGFHRSPQTASYRYVGEGSSKAVIAVVLALVSVSVGAAAGLVRRAPQPPADPTVATEAGSGESSIEVHVAGWVVDPGVVSVREGAIAAEAVEAAGGFRPGADTESINLAAEVLDGDQIMVPGPPQAAQVGDGPAQGSGGLLSLNRAEVSDLEQLPGVGPVLADRIISFREEHGRFEDVEDLLEVPGIGEAKLASIRDLVRP
jgi:competence protein ComEA